MGRLADDGPQLGGHTATMNVIRNCQPRHGSAPTQRRHRITLMLCTAEEVPLQMGWQMMVPNWVATQRQ